MDYKRSDYLRLLKMIEWFSAHSEGPGVDVTTLDDALFNMQLGYPPNRNFVLKGAEVVGHIKIVSVPRPNQCEQELVMLTPEGHDYVYRFTRSAETGTRWDEQLMKCKTPYNTPQTTSSLWRREVV